LERWPPGLRIMKVLSPAVVLDREEEQFNMHVQRVQRFTFTDWLDLDSYFREWLVHQSSDKSDLKVEMSHRGVREVLQMDLRARTVELGDKSRLVGQMMDRMIVLSTVSQSGVCQSLMMGEIFLAVPTSATMLAWRELEENNEKIITLHRELSMTKNSLLLSSHNQMHFMAPCLTSSSTFLIGKLATAEVLLPLPDCGGVDLGSEVVEDRRVVGVLRELEHHSIYNPLDYNMGKLDSAREKMASGRQGAGEKVGQPDPPSV
jgi:hypothetical protein